MDHQELCFLVKGPSRDRGQHVERRLAMRGNREQSAPPSRDPAPAERRRHLRGRIPRPRMRAGR